MRITNNVAETFANGKSVWRSFMNQRILGLCIRTPILDLGAGVKGTSSYHEVISGFNKMKLYSVDIIAEKNPTVVADLEKILPFKKESFLTILAFNILEHIFDYQKVLCEVHRILGPGGRAYIAVPFLLRVHSDPDDFYRYTEAALKKSLGISGFSNINIEAFGSGALTGALCQIDFLIPVKYLRKAVFKFCFHIDSLISHKSKGRYRNKHDYPVGYFVTAVKEHTY